MINSLNGRIIMIQYTRSYTRPSTLVAWWFEVTLAVPRSVFHDRMIAAYYATGKVLLEDTVISPDGLTLTWTGMWESEVAFNEYDVDSVLSTYWVLKDEYNTSVDIIKGPLGMQTI